MDGAGGTGETGILHFASDRLHHYIVHLEFVFAAGPPLPLALM